MADLVEKYRSAPITTVTVARQKLLDYGQPALRRSEPLDAADREHGFTSSCSPLYDSLAQAPSILVGRGLNSATAPRDALIPPRTSGHEPRLPQMTDSRFFRDRSIWTTMPSRPIRTLAGISAIPYALAKSRSPVPFMSVGQGTL